jgi:DNA-directed RNA polymerase subunit RPC12/RpoP
MDDNLKYVLHCNQCNYKRFSNGNDIDDLLPVKQTKIQTNIPKYDYRSKKTIIHPEKGRLKMYKCPKCGFTIKAYNLIKEQDIEEESDE